MAKKKPRLYHGARTRIDGGMVLPPSVTGVDARNSNPNTYSGGSDGPHNENAWATDSSHVAWKYATGQSSWHAAPENNDPDPKYRSRVYEVEKAPDTVHDGSEYSSQNGFKIIGEVPSRPNVTMTFPQFNWNAFKGRRGKFMLSDSDKNHWDDRDDPNYTPPKAPETAPEGHPDQLNLFSGRTKAEHEEFEKTPIVHLEGRPDLTLGKHAVENPEEIARDPLSVAKQQKESQKLAKEMSYNSSIQFAAAKPDGGRE